jgi:hypothetical protein
MQGSDSYRLVVRRGPQPNQVYELKDEVINLGRDITNNIVINDREVSRHHLRLMRGAEGYTIEDLGSTNGTFINGKRVTGATPLKNGDMIGLGETVTLGYELMRAGMSPAANPAPPARPYQPAPTPATPAPEQAVFPTPQPQPPAASPYQPQPSQPDPYAPQYQPPQPQYAPQPQYQAPAADPYQQQQPAYQDPYQQAYSPPPPPGYGYDQHDPFGMREEEGSNSMRLLLFGCLGLMLFCCCITITAVVLVDTFDLYCSIPVISNIVEALGLKRC